MAQIIQNKKNFKILKFTQEEAYKLGWGIPDTIKTTEKDGFTIVEHEGNSLNKGACLCAHCNNIIQEPIYFSVVLWDTLCKECYDSWINNPNTINYAEDREYEENAYDNLIKDMRAQHIPLDVENN